MPEYVCSFCDEFASDNEQEFLAHYFSEHCTDGLQVTPEERDAIRLALQYERVGYQGLEEDVKTVCEWLNEARMVEGAMLGVKRGQMSLSVSPEGEVLIMILGDSDTTPSH